MKPEKGEKTPTICCLHFSLEQCSFHDIEIFAHNLVDMNNKENSKCVLFVWRYDETFPRCILAQKNDQISTVASFRRTNWWLSEF